MPLVRRRAWYWAWVGTLAETRSVLRRGGWPSAVSSAGVPPLILRRSASGVPRAMSSG